MASGEAYQLLNTKPSLDSTYRDSDDDDSGTSYLPGSSSSSRLTHHLRNHLSLILSAALALLLLALAFTAALLPSSPSDLSPAANSTKRVERDPRVSLSAYLHSQFNPSDIVAWTFATETYVLAIRNWDARRAEVGLPDTVVTLCLDVACLDEVERTGGRAYGGFLKEYVELPMPTKMGKRGELATRGEERGHFMAFCKFKAMLEINQSGFNSFFFEGDTFFREDFFPHMRSLDDPSWDMQFTEDLGYIMNFGWIFMRSCEATITYWEHTLKEYLRQNQWDQSLISQVVKADGGREISNSFASDHWWLVDDYNLRISLLPLSKFLANHVVALGWYTPDPTLPEPIMRHLTAITYANRQFYPKEQGWWTNLDSYYTRPRAILTSSPLSGTPAQILADARLLSSIANLTGRAFQVPPNVSITNPDGVTYVRDYTRVLSIQTAIDTHSDLLEANFFTHAARYLEPSLLALWESPPVSISLTAFASAQELIEFIEARPEDEYEVLRLEGFREAKVEEWGLEGVGVGEGFKRVGLCGQYEVEKLRLQARRSSSFEVVLKLAPRRSSPRVCADLFQPRNQPILLLLLLFNASVLVFYHFTSPIPLPSSSLSATSSCEVCVATPSDPLCLQYGLDNIRLSRAYEGSGHRVRRFVEKALRGEEVSVGIIGASVSLGHGLDGAPTWHAVFVEALRELFPKVVVYDGSAAAMDSAFFSFCFGTMVPDDLDLYLVELDINNDTSERTIKADDTLNRVLLGLPQMPAVIRASVFALSFNDLARGFPSNLLTSQFFDVPIITIRNFLLPHLIIHREEPREFFGNLPGGVLDLRHVGVDSHRALGDMLTLFIRKQLCEVLRRRERPPRFASGIWPKEDILGSVPSQFLWDKFTGGHAPTRITPSCSFAISPTHPLLPLPRHSPSWTQIEWNGKKAWQSSVVGDFISFAFRGTRVGLFVWTTNGVGSEVGPGRAACWIGDELEELRVIEGWSGSGISGPSWSLVGDDLPLADYVLTCQILKESSTAGHDFRIMGIAAQ